MLLVAARARTKSGKKETERSVGCQGGRVAVGRKRHVRNWGKKRWVRARLWLPGAWGCDAAEDPSGSTVHATLRVRLWWPCHSIPLPQVLLTLPLHQGQFWASSPSDLCILYKPRDAYRDRHWSLHPFA